MTPPENNRSGASHDAQPTVFVVDDEPMLLDLASVVLEAAGYRVRTFRDGEVALHAFQSAPAKPALIVTDFAMHSMSGMDLIRECRRLVPQQKILLVSGTVDEGIYSRSPDKPNRFLAKPYQAEQLTEIVRTLVKS